GSGPLAGRVRQPEHRHQEVGPAAGVGQAHPVQPALEDKVLPAGEVDIDPDELARIADHPADLFGLPVDVVAAHEGPAGGLGQQGDQDADGGGLARPVGAEEPEDLSPRDLERDVVDGAGTVRVDLHQVLDVDQIGHFVFTPFEGSIPSISVLTTSRANCSSLPTLASSPISASTDAWLKQAPRRSRAAGSVAALS